MKKWLKKYERVEVPAQYGTITRRNIQPDGTYVSSEERVLLREAGIEYRGGRLKNLYETRSERHLIEKSREENINGEQVLIPAKYKTVTKQVIVRSEFLPPDRAVKVVTFLCRRDVRKDFLKTLNAEFSEDQVPHFGLLGGDIWYWKEVLAFLFKRSLTSPIIAVLGDFVPRNHVVANEDNGESDFAISPSDAP